MGLLALDGLPGQYEEVAGVPRDETSPLPAGIGKLFRICELNVPRLVGAHGIDPPSPQGFGNPWREVFIQIELHALRALAVASAVGTSRASASFSAKSASISSV